MVCHSAPQHNPHQHTAQHITAGVCGEGAEETNGVPPPNENNSSNGGRGHEWAEGTPPPHPHPTPTHKHMHTPTTTAQYTRHTHAHTYNHLQRLHRTHTWGQPLPRGVERGGRPRNSSGRGLGHASNNLPSTQRSTHTRTHAHKTHNQSDATQATHSTSAETRSRMQTAPHTHGDTRAKQKQAKILPFPMPRSCCPSQRCS